jgi:hypothetical protein
MEELHLKRTAYSPFSLDIASLDFFLFGWLKIEIASRPVAEIDELLKSCRKFWTFSQLRQSPAFLQLDRKTETNY